MRAGDATKKKVLFGEFTCLKPFSCLFLRGDRCARASLSCLFSSVRSDREDTETGSRAGSKVTWLRCIGRLLRNFGIPCMLLKESRGDKKACDE